MVGFTSTELAALLAAWWLPFCRVAALFSSAPVLSHRAFPVRMRLAAALVISAAVAAGGGAPAPPQGSLMILAAAEQVAIGLAMGFTMQLVFAGANLAGELVGLQMGLGFGTLFDPAGGGQTPAVGAFFSITALLLFVGMDGHLVLIQAVAVSLRELPPGALVSRLDPVRLAQAGEVVFRTGLSIALPALAGLLLVNIAFGLVARVSPQLNVFAVGFPATLFAGLALLALTVPAWVAAIANAIGTMLATLGR
ncbi:MAG: flagellar biosynthetic protein FliR [Betaproteobacteria bacterium]|nr:flagellar biosynthetic protein FliR [Betaproteobacteria bacterium]